MGKFVDRTGQRFGRLLVESRADSVTGRTYWNVLCECGTRKAVALSALMGGRTQSCGCLHDEAARRSLTTRGKSGTRTHRIWKGMVARCTIPSASGYPEYGAVGITVCDRWRSFENFLADMGECPEGQTLDRVKNELGYEPGNCRWADRVTQNTNRSSVRMVSVGGETHSISEWARRIGISEATLRFRIRRGRTPQEAIAMGR